MNDSYKGKILISTPDVSHDIFSRSVVLIVDHDKNGAFGLILNKENKKISQNIKELVGFDVPIYEGGPMENDKIFFMVKGKPTTEFYIEINSEFYLTEDLQSVLEEVLEEKKEIKVFSGYSGWMKQQLEAEIQKKYWQVVDIYNLDYTLPVNQNLWKNIMQNLGGDFLIWANAPEDISMN